MKQAFLNISHKKQGHPGILRTSIGNDTWNSQIKTLILILVCFFSVQTFYSQEEDGVVSLALPVRNSLTFNRYVINPTFSFVREQNKYISVYNKREWVQFEDAPQTYLVGYSGRISENIGAGVGLFQQDYGVLTTYGGILNFAYNARLDRDSNLTFGLNLGVYKSGLNTGKVITNFDDPSLNNIPSNLLLTVNPGINYGTAFLDFGISVNNVVLYNVQSSELIQDDPRQTIQAHAMFTGYMDSSGFFDEAKFSGLLRSEFGKENTTISGIAMLTVPKGIWAQVGYNTLYGASAGLGLNITKQIAIEYNYEKALGDLTNFGPSHDITLAFRFTNRTNYDYSDDDEIAGIFSSDKTRVLASSKPKKDAEARAKIAAESEAKREEIRERAKEKEETRAQLAAETQAEKTRLADAKITAENEAKQRAQERADIQVKAREEQQKIEVRAQQAREAQEKLEVQNKAKADSEAVDKLAAETKAKIGEEAKARLAAVEKAKVDAEFKSEAQARLAAEAKAYKEAQAKIAAEEKIQAAGQAKLATEAKVKADQEAKAQLAAQEKAAADAKAKTEAEAKLAAEAKVISDQVAKEKLAAEEKAKVKAEADAKLIAEARLKADQAAKAQLAAQEKAQADAKAKTEAEAKRAAEAKDVADQVTKDKLAAEAKLKEDQEAKAQLAAQEKAATDAKAQAEAQAKLVAETKAQAEAQAKLIAELKAEEATETQEAAQKRIEVETADALALEEKKKQQAEAQVKKDLENAAKTKREAEKAVIQNPTDAIAISMKSISDLTEASTMKQDELLVKFNEVVAGKDRDLQDLKEENDLSEQGIFSAPKAFKSITEENNKLQAISKDLDNIIETNNKRIDELEGLYKERIKIATLKNDEVTLYYQKALTSLKAKQAKAIRTRTQLNTTLKKINEATEFERKRRIKRAAYTNEEDRYAQDRASLRRIKQNTPLRPGSIKTEDFDFGETQSSNIQILKNINNSENGYYVVVAVHNDVSKRDEFIRNAVAAGQSNIDFFYDVSTSKYFIFYQKLDSIEAASAALETKGDQPYNGKMSIIKIEN